MKISQIKSIFNIFTPSRNAMTLQQNLVPINFDLEKCRKSTLYRYPSRFAKVDEVLMRSSQPSVDEIVFLKDKENLTDIFNVSNTAPIRATMEETAIAKKLNINYHAIPSMTREPDETKLKFFVDSVNKLKEKGDSKVLLHCNAGVDRTGTYTLFYQILNKMKNYNDAVAEMVKMGHFPEDIPELIPKIKTLLQKMKLV